ncbi:conserved membrane protein of unknown function [Streptantibioticus cattleyicolor NRRL 8057 = DSM 46488]|nr:conserved membrane protein of unknown function [Streptantibioticus cattleyicolor NRRL 8057 = DSM 46488]
MLVVAGVLGLQGGAVVAAGAYPVVGAAGMVALRLLIAAVVLVAVWRPGRPSTAGGGLVVVAAGTLLAAHHLGYYEALARIPLGAATTLEFAGPFAVALCGSRRPADLLWAALAAAGVVALSGFGGRLDPVGLGCAVLAGGCWAGYILLGRRLAGCLPGGQGLALAVAWAALLSLPYGVVRAGARLLDPGVLARAAVVAVVASVLPYSLQLLAVRRMPPRLFAVLCALEPAVGALLGLVALGQRLAGPQWAGVLAVVVAAAGSAGWRRRARPFTAGSPSPPPSPAAPPPRPAPRSAMRGWRCGRRGRRPPRAVRRRRAGVSRW